jgi:hypothetical protein
MGYHLSLCPATDRESQTDFLDGFLSGPVSAHSRSIRSMTDLVRIEEIGLAIAIHRRQQQGVVAGIT